MGAQGAWELYYEQRFGGPAVNVQMRTCDVHTATVGPGYIEAHEVTVARYRQWVLAGMPVPPSGTEIAHGYVWTGSRTLSARELPVRRLYNHQQSTNQKTLGDLDCLFDIRQGVNDDRPVNCVHEDNALVFCWWDGMELVSEIVWEYVATNRGTTSLPFGSIPTGVSPCILGDVGRVSGPCGTTTVPAPVGSFPRGDTLDPPGVHDLWGGLAEITLGLSRPYSCSQTINNSPCAINARPSYDGFFQNPCYRTIINRGLSFAGDAQFQTYFEHVRTRQTGTGSGSTGDVSAGFRCMRRSRPPTVPPWADAGAP